MSKKMLFLIMLSFSLAGGFWALKAQDPPAQPSSQERTTLPAVNATQTVQTDLSGTYTGTFNCDIAGLTGDTTLTINGTSLLPPMVRQGEL
jgi:hypothetical protein